MTKAETVNRNIKARLGYLRLPQSALANPLGITQQSVSSKLRGASPITLDELQIIASTLDVEADALLKDDYAVALNEVAIVRASNEIARVQAAVAKRDESASNVRNLLRQAYRAQVWVPLGYESWQDFLDREFPEAAQVLSKSEYEVGLR